MPVVHIQDLQEYQKIYSEKQTAVIKFTAEWCGPCRRIAPVYESLSKESDDIIFYEVNIDKAPGIADAESVTSIPVIVFVSNGENIKDLKMVGANADTLTKNVAKLKNQQIGIDEQEADNLASLSAQGVDFVSDYVTEITSYEDYKNIVSDVMSRGVIFFYLKKCKRSILNLPLFVQSAEKHHSVANFYFVDIEKHPDIFSSENLRYVPYFVFFNDGNRLKSDEINKDINLLTFAIDSFVNTAKVHSVNNLDNYVSFVENHDCAVLFTIDGNFCSQISDYFDQLSKESKLKFIKINSNNNSDIVEHEQIKAIPSCIFYKYGERIKDTTIVGVNSDHLFSIVKNWSFDEQVTFSE